MSFRSVVITQHSKLSYSSSMMVVHNRDGVHQIPIDDIGLLLIDTSQAVITSALISELASHRVKVVFVDDAYQPICETCDYYPGNRKLTKLKEQFNWDENRKQLLWTKIVRAKILNQMHVLENYKLDTAEINNELDKLEIDDSSNREAVVARKYFMKLFDPKFVRQIENGVNAALDYGYAILLSSFDREIVANGYLTYLGIHHCSTENQFNLGSDLMEPFRPVVDYWVKAHEKITQLTPDIKYGLVELLSLEIKYNGKNTLLTNAIGFYVRDCMKYLSGKIDHIDIEMEFINEVPNDAINDNV